ncbi:MAG: chemotaxis protein CheW, partial [bacterium]
MQIVTFQLAGERYGLPIDTIQEIIMDRDVTRVPNLPTFLKGIIHLRDSVIPIVDGIERLGYHDREKGFENGRIVIVEYNKQLIGIRVATADDVLD